LLALDAPEGDQRMHALIRCRNKQKTFEKCGLLPPMHAEKHFLISMLLTVTVLGRSLLFDKPFYEQAGLPNTINRSGHLLQDFRSIMCSDTKQIFLYYSSLCFEWQWILQRYFYNPKGRLNLPPPYSPAGFWQETLQKYYPSVDSEHQAVAIWAVSRRLLL
jgi:hypothetical protein